MLVVPILLLITLLVAIIKKIHVYDSFVAGTREALQLVIGILPYLATIFIAIELMRLSGLSKVLSSFVSPAFALLGIPEELCELIILRPLSGSGSIAMLESIYAQYGVDSYVSRCASVIVGSSDTILYITAVYFSTSKDKRSGLAVPISLAATFFGTVLSCLICRVM